MDQRVPKRSEINRIKQLEQEFETNTKTGLITSEANRRLSENRFEYLTKEKKRSWLRSAEQECLDPLFFFLFFLCCFFFAVRENGWQIPFAALLALLILKGRQAVKNKEFIQKRKELFLPKAQVMRDGSYRYIDVREIVVGDVLRLKKGEKVPAAVGSLRYPGKIYEKGRIFPEESGKAVAVAAPGSTSLKAKGALARMLEESETFPLRAQEMLYRKGVITMETARMPEGGQRGAVILDSEYFPGEGGIRVYGQLFRELKKRRMPLIFFAQGEKENIFSLLNREGILQNRREIVEREQFACYSREQFQRQMESIKVYIGLEREEKQRVIANWKNKLGFVYVMANPNESYDGRRQKEERSENGAGEDKKRKTAKTVRMALLDRKENESDHYFTCRTAEGILYLIKGEEQWLFYDEYIKKVQEKVLAALCIFNGVLLLAGIIENTPQSFQWMFFLSAVTCGCLAVWKEVLWLWISKNFKNQRFF